jgi:hypothetical protein
MFIPFFNFGHMLLDITTYTTGKLDTLTNTFVPGPGFPWSSLYETIPDYLLSSYDGQYPSLPPPVQAWYFLIMNVGFYALLTWFFDNVLPDAFGASRPPWFFLTPDYWGFRFKDTSTQRDDWLKRYAPTKETNVGEDDDVAKEREKALSPEFWPAVKVVNLRKLYRGNCGKRSMDKVAVKNSSVTFEEGKLFALLGQNGAGKTVKTLLFMICKKHVF